MGGNHHTKETLANMLETSENMLVSLLVNMMENSVNNSATSAYKLVKLASTLYCLANNLIHLTNTVATVNNSLIHLANNAYCRLVYAEVKTVNKSAMSVNIWMMSENIVVSSVCIVGCHHTRVKQGNMMVKSANISATRVNMTVM